MAKLDLLRVWDVRDAYRLIGECRDLGSDPALWQARMLDGVRDLVGVSAVAGGEGRWVRPHSRLEVISAFDAGLDSRARKLHMAYHRAVGPDGDPIFRALRHVRGGYVTRTRKQVLSDSRWYRSVVFNEYYRPIGLDEPLVSLYQVSEGGLINVIGLTRARGDRPFSSRQQQLLTFFHTELGPMIGRSLVSVAEPSPDALAPRLRQTLACLLEGDSEKQVASRLGLSQATTHEYVTAVYRHFGVQSRAQLMAHAIKRLAQREWRQLYGSSNR